MHERVQLCQDPQTEFAFLRESLGVGRINHILRVHGHTQSFRNSELQRSPTRSGSGLSNRSSQVSPRNVRRKRHSVLASLESGTKERDTALILGALKAPKRRIQAMMQDAVWTGLLPEQTLESQSSRGPPSTQKPRPSSNSISSSAQRESHCSRFFTGVAVPFTAQSTTFTGGCPTYS